MYECPNCGGNLRFDISSQQLACGYCNAEYDPYEIAKDKDAEESTNYEVTVFTCPQCAGEIYSTDNTAAGFCSFCGASTILDSRLRKEKRPDYIIPFQKTKEDCKTEYIKRVKRAVFAPKELRHPEKIDSFRGIYMPYWVYYFTQKGSLHLKGTTEHRSGDYIIKEHYILTGDIDNHYKGLSYDASSSFADNISERIAPFDVKNMKSFTPSILSGFYADIPDVDKEIYQLDAEQEANEQTKQYLKHARGISKYNIESSDNASKEYHTRCEETNVAMFPVWFMSYRNRDRVAYATVNGQTGKVVADLPVDIKKYMLGSFILAVPLFILLNLFFTMVPAVALGITSVIAMIVTILYHWEVKRIAQKERYEDDKGVQDAIRKKRQAESEAAAALDGMAPYVTVNKHIPQKKKKLSIAKCVIGGILLWNIILCLCVGMQISGGFLGSALFILIVLVVTLIFGIKSLVNVKNITVQKGIPGSVWTIAALILSAVIAFIKPTADIYYYISNILCLVAIFFALLDLISGYNILATRPLPQFEYRGGDDRA